MPGFNEVDNLDSMNAWATSIKLQLEAAGQIMRNPTMLKNERDFTELLRKIATDFIRDPPTKRAIYDIARDLDQTDIPLSEYDNFANTWDWVEQEMNVQTIQIIRDDMGLKLAMLSFMAGPKPPKQHYSLKRVEEIINEGMGNDNR